jgi:hypothetical protein
MGDKGNTSREFEARRSPRSAGCRFGSPAATSQLVVLASAQIRQRIESIFRTCKDLLTLERHAARTISGEGSDQRRS